MQGFSVKGAANAYPFLLYLARLNQGSRGKYSPGWDKGAGVISTAVGAFCWQAAPYFALHLSPAAARMPGSASSPAGRLPMPNFVADF